MSEWVSAGKVRMTPKGIHDATATYDVLDVVTNTDSTILYIAKKDVPAGTVLTNTEYWEVILNIEDSIEELNDKVASLEDDVGDAKDDIEELQNDVSELQNKTDDVEDISLSAYSTKSTSGNVVSFLDGADNVPIKDLVTSIEPQQSGSGDPSPTNIRTISGFSACLVTVHGENLYDSTRNVTGHLDISDGTVVENISDTTQVTDYLEVNDEELLITGHIFTAHDTSGFETVNACIYDEDKVFVRRNPVLYMQSGNGVAGIPINDGEKYVRYTITSNNVNNSNYKFYPSRSYTTNWFTTAGTVYGGTLNVTTGMLTVDRVMFTIDGNSSLEGLDTANEGFNRVTYAPYGSIGVSNIKFDYCDKFICDGPRDTHSLYDVWNSTSASSPRMFFGLPKTVTTLDEAKAWFAENPTHVVAKIASPQTYQLNPVEVRTLLGANTFSANCGDVSVTYHVDPTLQHDNLSAGDVGFSIMAQYANNTVGAILREVYDNLFEAIQDIGKLDVAIDSTKMLVYNEDGTVTWEDAPS